jgi:hypothetical protein
MSREDEARNPAKVWGFCILEVRKLLTRKLRKKGEAQRRLDHQNYLMMMRAPGDPLAGLTKEDWADVLKEQAAEEQANASPAPIVWPADSD